MRKIFRVRLGALFSALFCMSAAIGFIGCAVSDGSADYSSWRDRYQPAKNISGIMPYGGKTVCTQFYDQNLEKDVRDNVAAGYESLGVSIVGSWRSNLATGQSVEDLKRFGESVGADLVTYGLVSQEYQARVNGVLRMWVANYWRRAKPDPYSIQARFRDLSEDESRRIGTRGGSVVLLVIRGGPAYQSDIFAGDIVMELDGVKIQDAKDLRTKCKSMAGRELTLSIFRDGVAMRKVVRLYPQLK